MQVVEVSGTTWWIAHVEICNNEAKQEGVDSYAELRFKCLPETERSIYSREGCWSVVVLRSACRQCLNLCR